MFSIADYIFTVNNETRLGLHLSGGADSALLLYMLCVYKINVRPEIELLPLVFQVEEKNYQVKSTLQIIELITRLTGVKLQPIIFDPTPQQDLEVVKKIETRHLFVKEIIDCNFNGVTASNFNVVTDNPLSFVCDDYNKKINNTDIKLLRSKQKMDTFFHRFKVNNKICFTYRPFVNIDKKEIYELYKTYDLLDNLFPLTRSCNELGRHTISHCGKCFWCFERFWGFGRY